MPFLSAVALLRPRWPRRTPGRWLGGLLPLLLALAAPAAEPPPAPPPALGPVTPASALPPGYTEAKVDAAKTSIYIGSVTLDLTLFRRLGQRYESTYTARVFPYFFYNEAGRIAIDLSDDDLRRLAAGERVEFKGHAETNRGEPRNVAGHATPESPTAGTIKVRVWVTSRIELIFNTRYRFTGKEP